MERPVIIPYEGQNMVGMLHIPDNLKQNAWVVMIHGIGDTKVENHRMFVKMARRLIKHGIGSLRIDLIGCGDSEGDFEDMTISGQIEQTIACVDWLREKYSESSKIGLLGFSLGGCVTACASARIKGTRTLVLWSPVSDPYWNMHNYMGDEVFVRGMKGGTICIPDGDALKGEFFRELSIINPVMELKQFNKPVLLIQGTADEAIFPVNATRYEEAFVHPHSKVHYVHGASHRYDNLEHEKELLDSTEAWISNNLGITL